MTLNTRLFVGNLPENLDENSLREAFSSYGDITNIDLKCKPGVECDSKKRFAFITVSASNLNIESCLKYFSNEDFNGNRLYVTRARESFLERLQREREQTVEKVAKEHLPSNKRIVSDQHNTQKRRFTHDNKLNCEDHYIKKSKVSPVGEVSDPADSNIKIKHNDAFHNKSNKKPREDNKVDDSLFSNDEKKQNADKRRQDSMLKKRQEFKEKKNIIKTGLISIDKQQNKKIIFSDNEEGNTIQESLKTNGHNEMSHKTPLFDEGGSDNEINFEVKNQYEGKKGQKVLDLQSKFKSDKRFILDERFIEESGSDKDEENKVDQEDVDLKQADEKSKQLNILQDVLGVTIRTKTADTTNKNKAKLGMLRFDPTQPEHAKYIVPVSNIQDSPKKSKKKKSKETKDEDTQKEEELAIEKVEVSKEQFYKISDTLKETLTQPNTFSLRSLFSNEDDKQHDGVTEDAEYGTLQTKNSTKIKNPLDPGETNPFIYDSSDSENEDMNNESEIKHLEQASDIKTVWCEKLFFSESDRRLKDGLNFFTDLKDNTALKERRELKSLMKKRIYNKERKNTMFQKKIGGRKKVIRKKFRKS